MVNVSIKKVVCGASSSSELFTLKNERTVHYIIHTFISGGLDSLYPIFKISDETLQTCSASNFHNKNRNCSTVLWTRMCVSKNDGCIHSLEFTVGWENRGGQQIKLNRGSRWFKRTASSWNHIFITEDQTEPLQAPFTKICKSISCSSPSVLSLFVWSSLKGELHC